jgi:glycosyltransferase involved in cell wall biosynthesis
LKGITLADPPNIPSINPSFNKNLVMDKELLVTVILTVYKRTEYLEVALKSALDQTMKKFEIIIADDSGQNLAEPIYKLYKSDNRIIYQPNRKTLGIVNSVKLAIEKSRGKFISVLNDDDCWESNFLEKLTHPLCMDSNRVLAFSDHWIINADGEVDVLATEVNTKIYKRDSIQTGEVVDPKRMVLIDNGVPLAMAAIFRKDAISLKMLVSDVSGAYDFWISCLLASTGRPFYYLNERLTRYRVHSTMETGRRSIDKQLNMIYIFNSLLNLNMFPEYVNYITRRVSFYLYKAGRDNLYFNQFADARSYFRKAIKLSFNYRSVIALGLSYFPVKILRRISF